MTDITTNAAAIGRPANPLTRLFERIGKALVAMSMANGRLRHVEALNALSDEALARRGLKRADIVHHVFRDVYWM
jgi:uncharacterized protein YjiS (DUF1127 family)